MEMLQTLLQLYTNELQCTMNCTLSSYGSSVPSLTLVQKFSSGTFWTNLYNMENLRYNSSFGKLPSSLTAIPHGEKNPSGCTIR